MRPGLVAALSACVTVAKRTKARRFLQGLSADELQFIAEFLGYCILDGDGPATSHAFEQFQESKARFAIDREDYDHKLIVLGEYLCRCAVPVAAAVRAGGA